MKKFVKIYLDTYRMYNDGLEAYTCWNTIFNLRPLNLGTRIDYVLCTKNIECTGSGILTEVIGSDHCPVFGEFNIDEYSDDSKNLVKRKNNLLGFFNLERPRNN